MKSRAVRLSLTFVLLLSLAAVHGPHVARVDKGALSRLAQLVEANVIAVHAYQILLARKSGKDYAACYSPGKLSDAELEALNEHQARLLKS
ncbi:MAG TPA: hypothetical protein VJT74_14910, partial [Pyrinomonadaceae bacterium]|nr:hypothetical protein [Pyrinomonadaceae bacterium]